MAKSNLVFVTVPEGRIVPIPPQEGGAAGGALLRCLPSDADAKRVYALPWTTNTRRRINSGDLILSTRDGKPVKTRELAAAPDGVKLSHDGTVAADQRSDEEINAATPAPKFDTTDVKGKG